MPVYSGQLRTKRKAELEEIAAALNITLPVGYVKFDVEEGIRDALRANEAARKSPTFVNLWACMLEGRRTAVSDDTEEADEEEDSTEEEVIKAPTPRGSVARLGSHVVSPASTPSHAPANRAVARRRKSLASRSSANLRLAAQGVKEGTVSAVEKAQSGLSNAWILTAALVAAELGFVAYNAIPLHHVTLGPHTWLSRSPTPAFTFTLPLLSVLYHRTFLLPLFSYILTTLLLPLLLSLLTAAPRHTRAARKGVAPPNATAFNIWRLAIVVLGQYILAKEVNKKEWSFEHVKGYPAIQVLGTTVALVLTAYEGVVNK